MSLAPFVGLLIPKLPTGMNLLAMVLYAGHVHDSHRHTAFLLELECILFASCVSNCREASVAQDRSANGPLPDSIVKAAGQRVASSAVASPQELQPRYSSMWQGGGQAQGCHVTEHTPFTYHLCISNALLWGRCLSQREWTSAPTPCIQNGAWPCRVLADRREP